MASGSRSGVGAASLLAHIPNQHRYGPASPATARTMNDGRDSTSGCWINIPRCRQARQKKFSDAGKTTGSDAKDRWKGPGRHLSCSAGRSSWISGSASNS